MTYWMHKKDQTPEKRLDFVWPKTGFNAAFEQQARRLVNLNGGGNSAYSVDVLPQDRMVKAWGWVHGKTGLTCQFQWLSGRLDALVVPDVDTPEAQYAVHGVMAALFMLEQPDFML